jgi:hypothetical protein
MTQNHALHNATESETATARLHHAHKIQLHYKNIGIQNQKKCKD